MLVEGVIPVVRMRVGAILMAVVMVMIVVMAMVVVIMIVTVVSIVMGGVLRLCSFVVGGIFEGVSRTQRVCLPGAAGAKETACAARGKWHRVARGFLQFMVRGFAGRGQTGGVEGLLTGLCGGHVTLQ